MKLQKKGLFGVGQNNAGGPGAPVGHCTWWRPGGINRGHIKLSIPPGFHQLQGPAGSSWA